MAILSLKLSGKNYAVSVLVIALCRHRVQFPGRFLRKTTGSRHIRHLAHVWTPVLTGSIEFHPTLNCWDYKMASTCFFGPIFPNPFQFSLCASNSSTCDMYIIRVLPVLSLLLGARASPFDSSKEASHRLDVRATSQICFPFSTVGVIPGIDSQTGGSTFSS